MKRVDKKVVLFRVIIKRNQKANKILFYLTSYGFPWWVYLYQIFRFRQLGYQVVVYDFYDKIIENDDPSILTRAVSEVVSDMAERRKKYEETGITIYDGIGNSLGSYFLFNYAIRYPIRSIVLNSGGSIADIYAYHKKGSWKQIADAYSSKGYDNIGLRQFWLKHDDKVLARQIKADKTLMLWSINDGTIPHESPEQFLPYFKQSGKLFVTETDVLPHVLSVIKNSLKIKKLYRFLNSDK